ncbi:MAG TPA: acetyl-CoA carboxylase, carboxyltransferase subunit beta [Thermomicrobiales bacterium]|nr:acetyl-CoA carboxylase, carboxyltransferase subunit beta [Thermomicrobiales bacterium]
MQVPDDLWVKCPGCQELSYTKEHLRALRVCHRCGYHYRLTAHDRIALLADEGSFQEWDPDLTTDDPLDFKVGDESYLDKATSTAIKSGIPEAVISGEMTVGGRRLAIVVADFAFMGASMGSVYGEKLTRACERAVEMEIPLLTVSSSGGARMQEGLFSLLQMAKTTTALSRLGHARLPHFSLLTDPCYGGVTASYATSADIVMAEPGARIGFAGPRVIEQVTRQKLPEGFQTAEFLLAHGLIDRVVPRGELLKTLQTLIDLYQAACSTSPDRATTEALAPASANGVTDGD